MVSQVTVVLNRTVVDSQSQQQSIQNYSYPENYIPPICVIIYCWFYKSIIDVSVFFSTSTLLSLFATTFHHYYCIKALLCLISALLLKKCFGGWESGAGTGSRMNFFGGSVG